MTLRGVHCDSSVRAPDERNESKLKFDLANGKTKDKKHNDLTKGNEVSKGMRRDVFETF